MCAKLSANYLLVILFVSGVFLTKEVHAQGRTPNPPPINTNPDIESVGAAMDELAGRAEEWGTLHMSAPLLIEPSTNFNFSLQRGASNYFSEAKSEIQAATAAAAQQIQSFNLALQVQNMPGLPNSATSIGSSNLPNSSAILGTNANATTVFSSPGFTAPLGLLGGLGAPNPTLNNTAALDIAAADQTTEAIFRLFGDPEKAAQYAGRKVLFGTVTVAVNPGYRTKQDYVADLAVLPRFEYRPARLEIVKRWLQGTNLTDEIRAVVLISYDLTNDADLISKIPWIGQHDPFDKVKTAISDLNDLKAKIAAVDEALKTAKNDAFKKALTSASPKPPPEKDPPPAPKPPTSSPSAKALPAPEPHTTPTPAAVPDPAPVQPAHNPLAPESPAQQIPPEVGHLPPKLNIPPESQTTGCFDDKSNQLLDLRRCLTEEFNKAEQTYERLLWLMGDGAHAWIQTIPDEMKDTNNQPLAMAVSPLADLDVTDEGSSQRSQSSLALSLAGLLQKAGLQAQAAAYEQYAKRIESDAHTRSALPVVNSYGDGGLFGWQIGPRFRAMKDPSLKDKVPANILDRQTFPALIMVGFNQEDLNPRLRRDCGKVKVLEPFLAFHTVPRWLRAKDCGWGRLWQKSYSETALLAAKSHLIDATNAHLSHLVERYGSVVSTAQYRVRALSFEVFGNDTGQLFDLQQVAPLPDASAPSPPAIAGIYPMDILLKPDAHGDPLPMDVAFTVVGNNLKSMVKVTPLIGKVAIVPSLTANNNVVQFKGTVSAKGPIVFQFAANSTNSAGTVTTNYPFAPNIVQVHFDKSPHAPESVVQTVETLPSATNAIGEFTVKISPHPDPESVKAALSIIINEINKAKPQDNANVSVQVQAEQKK